MVVAPGDLVATGNTSCDFLGGIPAAAAAQIQ